MSNKPYHHGNLKNELIEKGIELVGKEGYDSFSIRKVAKMAGVSANACYNHFEDKEALLRAMKDYVNEKFAEALSNAYGLDDKWPLINIGKAYVNFFVEHPKYFPFIYDKDDYQIVLSEKDMTGDLKAFSIFRECAVAEMKKHGVPQDKFRDNLLVMWSAVQGLSAMANMQGFRYDGDWGELTETILLEKINLR